ncbi:hypothetical protein [Bacillus vallismortis]|uniref:hypothetical protein n=1 Tax=Bacillus vallismortis TaxID=72361 RepID=UPI003B984FB8
MDIFLINMINITENEFKIMQGSIEKSVLEEINAIKVKQERDRRIASRYLLKVLLRDRLNIPFGTIEITENRYGKKKCLNNLNLHFNIPFWKMGSNCF